MVHSVGVQDTGDLPESESCPATFPLTHGGFYRCTEPLDHDGDHVARSVGGTELARWPQEPSSSDAYPIPSTPEYRARFDLGLAVDVANVLVDHGLPKPSSDADWASLALTLYRYVYSVDRP